MHVANLRGELCLAQSAVDGLDLEPLAGEELVGAGVNVLEEENLDLIFGNEVSGASVGLVMGNRCVDLIGAE